MKYAILAMVFLMGSDLVFARDQGRSGSWFYVIERDPLDDRPVTKLGAPAVGGQGRMVIFCEGLFVEQIAVDWQSYIGFEADTLKYKFDDEPSVLESATTSRNGQAVLFKEHGLFDAMQKHSKLHIRAQTSEWEATDTLTFDLNGLREVMEKTAPYCSMAV